MTLSWVIVLQAGNRIYAEPLPKPRVHLRLVSMKRLTIIAAVGFISLLVTACADVPLGPVSPTSGYEPPPAEGGVFEARDFAWSQRGGGASIVGALAFHGSGGRYTCQGGDVILTPETPWSRRRMVVLYGSANSAAVPVSIVRARGPSAPSGDLARYVRKATCDASNRFSFSGLPNGAWYVITVAKPIDGQGESVAVSRRVETHGGPRAITLN